MTEVRHWINGEPGGVLEPQERAFHYGDGVFETLRIRASTAEFLDRHIQRLQEGCVRLELDPPDWSALRQEIIAHATGTDDAVLKVILGRGRGERGYGFRPGQGTTQLISLYPAAASNADYADTGVRVHVCDMRLAGQPRLAGIKHLNRLEQVLARAERHTDCQEGLMLDNQGNLIEGTMSNVFICVDGTLVTPRLDQCGVAGVMRSVVLDLAAALDIRTTVKPLQFETLNGNESMFLCNSLTGIWPIVSITGKGEFKIDALTRKLQQSLATADTRGNGNWYST